MHTASEMYDATVVEHAVLNEPPPNSHADNNKDKKHLKNVGPIRHCEPPHAALPFTRCRYCRIARRLRIDVRDDDDDDDDNDNAWQRGPLWPHGMGPTSVSAVGHEGRNVTPASSDRINVRKLKTKLSSLCLHCMSHSYKMPCCCRGTVRRACQ